MTWKRHADCSGSGSIGLTAKMQASARERRRLAAGIADASPCVMHMHIDLGQGHVFEGRAIEIVARMHRIAFGVSDLDLFEYIDWVLERAASLEGIFIAVAPGPIPARAEGLLRGLIAAGLARDLDADAETEEDQRTTLRFAVAAEVSAL
jgi:hypothetical protein